MHYVLAVIMILCHGIAYAKVKNRTIAWGINLTLMKTTFILGRRRKMLYILGPQPTSAL